MSVAIWGSAVVRMPDPDTLMKVTPARTMMMQKASKLFFGLFPGAVVASIETALLVFVPGSVIVDISNSNSTAGAVVVTVVCAMADGTAFQGLV